MLDSASVHHVVEAVVVVAAVDELDDSGHRFVDLRKMQLSVVLAAAE